MTDANPAPMIMILRHAEKPTTGKPHGVDFSGVHDHNSLTVAGWIRAGALVELFAPVARTPAAGLRRPDAIYGTAFAGGHSKRASQSVAPLAARLGIEVDLSFAHGEERELAERLLTHTGATVVSWHHKSIPRIIEHLGPVIPESPREWPPERFDVIWTFTRSADGWVFSQVPELLLPHDLPDPIPTGERAS
jgi:hypothetical protein